MVGLSGCAAESEAVTAFKADVEQYLVGTSPDDAVADAQSFCEFMIGYQESVPAENKMAALKGAIESARDAESFAIFTFAIDHFCPELKQ